MRRARLLILEGTSESREKRSERWLLWELMRILGYEKRTKFERIGGRNHLLQELENAEEQYLHISAHGDYHRTRGTYLITPRKGKVYASYMDNLWTGKKRSEILRLVVLSACKAGHIDMMRAFSRVGCRYCVAPLHETSFEDAAVFLTIFYRLLIGEKSSPWIAFRKAITGASSILPRLSGAWGFYEWGEKFFVQE